MGYLVLYLLIVGLAHAGRHYRPGWEPFVTGAETVAIVSLAVSAFGSRLKSFTGAVMARYRAAQTAESQEQELRRLRRNARQRERRARQRELREQRLAVGLQQMRVRQQEAIREHNQEVLREHNTRTAPKEPTKEAPPQKSRWQRLLEEDE